MLLVYNIMKLFITFLIGLAILCLSFCFLPCVHRQGRLVKRGVDGLLILLATLPGVLIVQHYYREAHILVDCGNWVKFSKEVGYITIDATISRSILMS